MLASETIVNSEIRFWGGKFSIKGGGGSFFQILEEGVIVQNILGGKDGTTLILVCILLFKARFPAMYISQNGF